MAQLVAPSNLSFLCLLGGCRSCQTRSTNFLSETQV
jgi:hypothetical protein